MVERRSTKPSGTGRARAVRQTQAQKEREDSKLVHVGALWDKESENPDVGQYYMGSISNQADPKTGLSDIDRLKDVLSNLLEGQSLTVLAFYNKSHDEKETAPMYLLSVTPYTPDNNGGSRRGGRR